MPVFDVVSPSSYIPSLFAFPPIVTALAILVLGSVVVLRERGSLVSLCFFGITMSVGVWLVTISGGLLARDEPVAMVWDRMVYLAVPLIPATIYQFSVTVLGVQMRRTWVLRLVWLSAIGFIPTIVATDALFARLYHYPWGYYPRYEWLGLPFLAWFIAVLVASLVEYGLAMRRSSPDTVYYQRARSFVVAFTIGYLGAIDYLPAYGVPVYPCGFLFILIFLGLAARTIHRFQLIDITPAFAAERIIATITDALIVVDPAGVICLVNQGAADLLCCPNEDLIGHQASRTPLGPVLDSAMAKLGASAASDGHDVYRAEYTWQPTRTVSLVASLMRDRDGRPAAVVCVVRDVTDRVQHEEDMRRQTEELRKAYAEIQHTQQQVIQQERLHALGQLASGVAHDFNNMLSVIISFAEMPLLYENDLADPNKMRETLELISAAGRDAATTVNRLREFYRYRAPNEDFSSVDLPTLVEDAMTLTRPRWKNQAQANGVVIDMSPRLAPVPAVLGSESEIRELLANLILNAVDAMPDGGTITIRTAEGAERVHLEVCDTGTGMTEEVRQRCLEPFFSTKGATGTGLGLSMVYGIVQRHRGDISIASELGRGTTFSIGFPIYRGVDAVIDDRPRDETVHPRRILLVDDEEPIRAILAASLAREGHTVVTAADGSSAIREFQLGPFDVVITDLGMPGMSGVDVAAGIKTLSPLTPIILMSGFGTILNPESGLPVGVDRVLSKPVLFPLLRAALESVTMDRSERSSTPSKPLAA